MKEPKVFISYASPDQAIATGVCNYLEAKDIPCWIAPRNITAGEDYAASIVAGIEECPVLIVVFSSAANNSKHVRNEIETAFNRKAFIIPFRIENVLPNNSLRYFLGSTHWLNAYEGKVEKYFPVLTDTCFSAIAPGKKEEKTRAVAKNENNGRPKNSYSKRSILFFTVLISFLTIGVIYFVSTNKTGTADTRTNNDSTVLIGNADSGSQAHQIPAHQKDSAGGRRYNYKQKPQSEQVANSSSQQAYENKPGIIVPEEINGTYYDRANYKKLTVSTTGNNIASFYGTIEGRRISGKMYATSELGFKVQEGNVSGTVDFSKEYKSMSISFVLNDNPSIEFSGTLPKDSY